MLVIKKDYSFILIGLIIVLLIAGNKVLNASAWNSSNDPIILDKSYEKNIDILPKEGELGKIPWTDSYWSSNSCGIAARWSIDNSYNIFSRLNNFNYSLYSEANLKNMSPDEIANLSPAEKYDIVKGNFDYPIVKSERKRCKLNNKYWEGLCNGWAQAALDFQEPKPVNIITNTGINVPFGSSDVKALLIYFLAVGSNNIKAKILGLRCNDSSLFNSSFVDSESYQDVNAASFHLILTNFIGIKKLGFLGDISQNAEVWNMPIYGYKSTIIEKNSISKNAAVNTVKEVSVTTVMKYRIESYPSWEQLGDNPSSIEKATYKYTLELNKNKEIIGGNWLSKSHPDFLWTREKPKFDEKHSTLEKLYNFSIKE